MYDEILDSMYETYTIVLDDKGCDYDSGEHYTLSETPEGQVCDTCQTAWCEMYYSDNGMHKYCPDCVESLGNYLDPDYY